jgi:leucyl aminopeptidase
MLNGYKIAAVPVSADAYAGADAVVLCLCKECVEYLAAIELPEDLARLVRQYVLADEGCLECGKVSRLAVPQGEGLLHLLLVGCGAGKECKPNAFRRAAGEAARALRLIKAERAVLAAPILTHAGREAYLECVTEGLYLGAYSFDKFKSDTKPKKTCSVSLMTFIDGVESLLERAELRGAAVSHARDLVNEPGNVVTPEAMAQEAIALAQRLPLTVEVLDESSLAEKDMRAILAVGQGSVNPPRLVVLRYNGAGDAPYTAFVGKGITFDSGGISIKPDDNMGEMKDDMSGAAAVLGALEALASMGARCNVLGVLACAENMPGGGAQRPGDIVRAASGKTIEVVSTDAEGRMVLADAVWYACRLGARRVIDIATLTGAVIVALGKETSGIISNDEALVEQIRSAGKRAGESYWQLPSLPECKEAIKSDVADLLNSAGRSGGCITGGLFIGEFVDKEVPWAHLDIGGTSTAEKTEGVKVKGGTAFGTLTLSRLGESL